jgi:hypothetical protein
MRHTARPRRKQFFGSGLIQLECEVLTYVSLYVTNRASILRILIAVLLCGGLCRLDWRHIHSHIAPEQASHQQMLREAIYEYGVVFRNCFPMRSVIPVSKPKEWGRRLFLNSINH